MKINPYSFQYNTAQKKPSFGCDSCEKIKNIIIKNIELENDEQKAKFAEYYLGELEAIRKSFSEVFSNPSDCIHEEYYKNCLKGFEDPDLIKQINILAQNRFPQQKDKYESLLGQPTVPITNFSSLPTNRN